MRIKQDALSKRSGCVWTEPQGLYIADPSNFTLYDPIFPSVQAFRFSDFSILHKEYIIDSCSHRIGERESSYTFIP